MAMFFASLYALVSLVYLVFVFYFLFRQTEFGNCLNPDWWVVPSNAGTMEFALIMYLGTLMLLITIRRIIME